MKLSAVCLVFTIAFAAAAPSCANGQVFEPASRCQEEDSQGRCTRYGVSLIELIANPEQFDGKPVRIIGYIHREFEGNGIYLHRDDEEQGIYANGLWVEFANGLEVADCQDRYVLIEGTFDARRRGHMGMWSGTVRDITRCMPWK